MTTIFNDYGTGGASITTRADTPAASRRHPPLALTLRDIAADLLALVASLAVTIANLGVADITSLRTKFIATLAKLDADASVNSTDYASSFTPAALTAAIITTSTGLVALVNALIVDVTAWRTQFVLALAHLDVDTGVTDTTYASLWTPAAITATSITTLSQVPAALTAIRADLTAIRAAYVGLLAKLDLDAGVTDTNYASSAAVAALTIQPMTTLLTIAG